MSLDHASHLASILDGCIAAGTRSIGQTIAQPGAVACQELQHQPYKLVCDRLQEDFLSCAPAAGTTSSIFMQLVYGCTTWTKYSIPLLVAPAWVLSPANIAVVGSRDRCQRAYLLRPAIGIVCIIQQCHCHTVETNC